MIRKANAKDAASIEAIRIKTWQSTYKDIISDKYLSELSIGKAKRIERLSARLVDDNMFVYFINEKMVGFIGYGSSRENPSYGEIYAIYILEAYQDKGIGKALIHEALKDTLQEKIWIWALKENPSIKVYEHLGGLVVDSKFLSLDNQSLEEVKFEFDKRTLITRTSLTGQTHLR